MTTRNAMVRESADALFSGTSTVAQRACSSSPGSRQGAAEID